MIKIVEYLGLASYYIIVSPCIQSICEKGEDNAISHYVILVINSMQWFQHYTMIIIDGCLRNSVGCYCVMIFVIILSLFLMETFCLQRRYL